MNDSQLEGEREICALVRDALQCATRELLGMHPELRVLHIVVGPGGIISLAASGGDLETAENVREFLIDVTASYTHMLGRRR